MNAIFAAEYASLSTHRDQSSINPNSNESFKIELSAPRRSREAREAKRGAYELCTRALERAMNAIFAAEYASLSTPRDLSSINPNSNESFKIELSAPRRCHEARKRGAECTG